MAVLPPQRLSPQVSLLSFSLFDHLKLIRSTQPSSRGCWQGALTHIPAGLGPCSSHVSPCSRRLTDGETKLVSDGVSTETQEAASSRERTPFLPRCLDPLPEPHTGSSLAAATSPLQHPPQGDRREEATWNSCSPEAGFFLSFPWG